MTEDRASTVLKLPPTIQGSHSSPSNRIVPHQSMHSKTHFKEEVSLPKETDTYHHIDTMLWKVQGARLVKSATNYLWTNNLERAWNL